MRHIRQIAKLSAAVATVLSLSSCFGPFKKSESKSTSSAKKSTASSTGSGSGSGSETTAAAPAATAAPAVPAAPAAPTVPAAPAVPGAKEGHGCLQGVVTDGFTGARIDLKGKEEQMFVLIHGRKLKAVFYEDAMLVGEYYICEIPLEETYPVFGYIDGYLPFESTVNIKEARAVYAGADQAITSEVLIRDPIALANVRLFPVGNTADQSLTVHVSAYGSPIKGARVSLEPQAAVGFFSFEGAFANTAGTRLLPSLVTTNDDGDAVFPAASLSLGTRYAIQVTPAGASALTSGSRSVFTLGIDKAAPGAESDDKNRWSINIDLDEVNQPLRIISCSTGFQNYEAGGTLKILFNRAIAIKNLDEYNATWNITNAGTAVTPPAKTDNDNVSELVAASLEGEDTLVLKPKFANDNQKPTALNPAKDINDTANASRDDNIIYDFPSIKVTSLSDSTNQATVALDALVTAAAVTCPSTVRFFPNNQ